MESLFLKERASLHVNKEESNLFHKSMVRNEKEFLNEFIAQEGLKSLNLWPRVDEEEERTKRSSTETKISLLKILKTMVKSMIERRVERGWRFRPEDNSVTEE